MIPKSEYLFSEKIMLHQGLAAGGYGKAFGIVPICGVGRR